MSLCALCTCKATVVNHRDGLGEGGGRAAGADCVGDVEDGVGDVPEERADNGTSGNEYVYVDM